MNLTYDAIDTSGRTTQDLIEADSIKAAVEQLRQRGLMVTNIQTASDRDVERQARSADVATTGSRLPLKQLVLFTRQMAMLLTSGSAVVPALEAIARQLRNPDHGSLIKKVKDDLEEGCTLTEALCRFPRAFDPTYCAVIAAGEASATLPQMFDRLSRIIGKRRAMRNKVLGSMAYPGLLIVLCTAVLSVLMFFVLPRFGDMFAMMSVPLPTFTTLLLAGAEGLRHYWPVVVLLVLGMAGGVVYLVVTPRGRQWCANGQLRIPLLGRLLSGLIQGQTFRTLGMLLEAHVGVLDALDLARRATKNNRFQALFDGVEGAVTSGNSLSGALESSRLVDAAICQAVRTGEESGNLGGAMSYVADVLDEDNTELLNTLTRLLEPTILIIMGVLVGAVAISLFLPLFDMTSMVQQ
ncbi:MAG TPA: type II secretion system F family protein [Phycisphaerae bacterium]|nr:type II secretion system F family protein [Phycisphaerae bacterium]